MSTYPVEREVLIWARDERGLSFDEAANELESHLGTDPSAKLKAIEDGNQLPTLTLLQAMAKKYEVSLITLFLPEPPPHTEKPSDFRTLGGQSPTLSPDALRAIRSARRQQETVAELAKDFPHLHKLVTLPRTTLRDRPAALAATERQRLGVTLAMQSSWVDGKEAFNAWRWFVEQIGVLVFRFDMPLDDCRGFSLSGYGSAPAIVVNGADTDEAQTFTLFHEYAHVLLGRFGICGQIENVDDHQLERFSNDFAANLLMPSDKVIELAELSSLDGRADFSIVLDAARTIANYFSVSVEAAVLRVERLGKAPKGSHDQYVAYVSQRKKKRRSRGGRGPYHRRYLNKLGNGYVSVVLGALQENLINAVEADDMLDGVKSRHFFALESDLAERHEQYGTAAKP